MRVLRTVLLGAAIAAPAPAAVAGEHDAAAKGPRAGAYPRDYYRSADFSIPCAGKMQAQTASLGPARDLPALGPAPCAGGYAGVYPCWNADLLSFLPLADVGGGNGNVVWGWVDPLTLREYALFGRSTGTSFIDVTDPTSPVYLGDLPTHAPDVSIWRDIRVHADHAYIVADREVRHGMQVFDLTQLRSVATPPVTFVETAHYDGFGSSHTLTINEETGFAFAAGSNTCAGGLHIVDIRVPTAPAFAGCVADDGYTHETQCVVYRGPDASHFGREICFSCNVDTLTIVDVTDKAAPLTLSRTAYSGSGFSHQGSLTEDHAWFLLDDEGDEFVQKRNTSTHVWDVADLDAPVRVGVHVASTPAIDHNLYVKGGRVYQANYRAGLRILDIECQGKGDGVGLDEVAYFDIYPDDDEAGYLGAWLVYPFFPSGIVAVSGMESGLFLVQPTLPPRLGFAPVPPVGGSLRAVRDGADVVLSTALAPPPEGGVNAYRSTSPRVEGQRLGGRPSSPDGSYRDADVMSDGTLYYYRMRFQDDCGLEGQ